MHTGRCEVVGSGGRVEVSNGRLTTPPVAVAGRATFASPRVRRLGCVAAASVVLAMACGRDVEAASTVGALTGGPREGALRAHEAERLDEIESLRTAGARERGRGELLEQLLRERLAEDGLLGRVERDPAGSSAIVERYLAPLREEFEAAVNPDDIAELERSRVAAAARWEPSQGDLDATDATLEVARLEGSPEPESFGEYGIEAERARFAAREAESRGAR